MCQTSHRRFAEASAAMSALGRFLNVLCLLFSDDLAPDLAVAVLFALGRPTAFAITLDLALATDLDAFTRLGGALAEAFDLGHPPAAAFDTGATVEGGTVEPDVAAVPEPFAGAAADAWALARGIPLLILLRQSSSKAVEKSMLLSAVGTELLASGAEEDDAAAGGTGALKLAQRLSNVGRPCNNELTVVA